MTRESLKLQGWIDYHGGIDPEEIPMAPPAYGRGFDDGWSAAIRAVAAAVSDHRESHKLIEGDAA